MPSGEYLFENLPPGNYLVDVYEDSFTTGGEREAVPTTDDVVAVTLAGPDEMEYLDADFGYFKGALIEGHVFHDDDRNGSLMHPKTPLPNIEVCLYESDGVTEVKCTTTDESGYYSFVVPADTYVVKYNTTETDAAGFPDPTTPLSQTVVAQAGPDWHVDLLFGVDYPGSIGDRVWNDADGDGAQTAGEPGIAGVTVWLCELTPCTAEDAIHTLATDADGNYEFPGLADGDYYVGVDTTTLPADTHNLVTATSAAPAVAPATARARWLTLTAAVQSPTSTSATNHLPNTTPSAVTCMMRQQRLILSPM